jgi:hypothetical protein
MLSLWACAMCALALTAQQAAAMRHASLLASQLQALRTKKHDRLKTPEPTSSGFLDVDHDKGTRMVRVGATHAGADFVRAACAFPPTHADPGRPPRSADPAVAAPGGAEPLGADPGALTWLAPPRGR